MKSLTKIIPLLLLAHLLVGNASAIFHATHRDLDPIYFITDCFAVHRSGTWHVPEPARAFQRPRDLSWKQHLLSGAGRWIARPDVDNENTARYHDRVHWLMSSAVEFGQVILLDDATVEMELKDGNFDINPAVSATINEHAVNHASLSMRLGLQDLTKDALPGQPLTGHDVNVQLLAPEGTIIVTDVDDTLKHTHVMEKIELIHRLLTTDYEPIDGAAKFLNRLVAQSTPSHPVNVIYLSATPMGLYPFYKMFLEDHGFPSGTLEMVPLMMDGLKAMSHLRHAHEFKVKTLKRWIKLFPNRRWIFLGDSGQSDPEAYADVAHELRKSHEGDTSWRIMIREVTHVNSPKRYVEVNSLERFNKAFHGLPYEQLRVFQHYEELDDAQIL